MTYLEYVNGNFDSNLFGRSAVEIDHQMLQDLQEYFEGNEIDAVQKYDQALLPDHDAEMLYNFRTESYEVRLRCTTRSSFIQIEFEENACRKNRRNQVFVEGELRYTYIAKIFCFIKCNGEELAVISCFDRPHMDRATGFWWADVREELFPPTIMPLQHLLKCQIMIAKEHFKIWALSLI
ncbi:uncharacterized protein LOC141910512 [Tubulanus polymorphus]|uniref:uncharacterized protein LOC141910512 n=1 Tax=Tubulanus polymorphus TaxID=672921 RepID=UPI003DA5A008